MDELEKLKQRRDATLKAAQEIISVANDEGRQVTPEENTKFDTLMGQYNDLDADIGRREQVQVAEARLKTVKRQIEPGPITPVPGATSRIEVIPPGSHIKLKAFTGPGAHERAYRMGMWCRANIFRDGKAKDWCRDHNVESRVMTEGVNVAGGFLVPTEMENAIINLRDTYGLARRECKIRQMSSDSEMVPRQTTGLTTYFVGETTATQASDLAYDQVQLTAKELSALARVSKSLSEDAVVSVADEIAKDMAYAFAKKEDECLVDGDGTNTYGGMVGFRAKMVDGNHDGSYVTATAADDQFTELLLADIISTIAVIPQYAHANAKWYMSQYAWGAAIVRLLAALGGNVVSQVTAGADKELMGYPVVLAPAMPSLTTAYNLTVMLAFGDMAMATTLGNRRGMTIEVDGSRYLEYRQLAIIGTERFDVVVHDIGTDTAGGPLAGFRGQT